MKTFQSAVLILAAVPLALCANTAVDRQIEQAAESSYNYRFALERRVKIRVDDGVATLTGKVSSDEQCRIAADTVANMPGVVGVNNQLKIKGEREGSDDMIALKVRSRLLVKANVSLVDTRVDVKDGVVFLKGKADDEAQKELTEEYAKDIDGVRAIRNELVVSDDEDREARRVVHSRRDIVCEKLDDSSITAQVKYELYVHKTTRDLKVSVATTNGHVVLSGEAMSETEKDSATRLAKSVRDVESVENDLVVHKMLARN